MPNLISIGLQEKYKPEIFLSNRSRKNLIPLPECYNRQWSLKLGKINELVFNYPYDSESINNYKDITQGKSFGLNDTVSLLKEKYLIKLVYGDYKEWFEIQSNSDMSDEESDFKTISCYSLAFELKSADIIIDYNVVSYTLAEILKGKVSENREGLLVNSLWQVGYIDPKIAEKYRSFSAVNKNLLECLDELAEIFYFVPVYDTENRIINFYDKNNIGENKGLVFDYGKYLSQIEKQNDAIDICTKLKVYGNDGLTIREINPIGTDYIEDYSFFMHPFQMNSLGNVIQSSNYGMSDELCTAITLYQEKIKEYGGNFTNALVQQRVYNQLLIAKNIEYADLLNILAQLKDSYELSRSGSGNSDMTIYYQKEIDKIEDKIEITNAQILSLNNKIKEVNATIKNIHFELSEKQNFTQAQINEKKLYTFVGDYVENAITTVDDLYKAALEYFEEVNKPKTVINISIVDFYDMVEGQEDWDKIILGDMVNVFYDKFNIRNESRFMEININFDSDDIALVIANMRDYEDNYELLAKMIYRNHSFAKEIKTSKVRWDSIQQVRDTLSSILANPFEELNLEQTIPFERIYDELERVDFEMPEFDFDWIPGYIQSLIPELQELTMPSESEAGYLKGFIAPFDPIPDMGEDFDLWFKYDDTEVI